MPQEVSELAARPVTIPRIGPDPSAGVSLDTAERFSLLRPPRVWPSGMTSLWAVCVCLTFGSGWALRRLGIATDNESGDATKGEAALTAEQVATLQSALADQRTHCHGLEQQVQRAGRAQHEQQRKLVEQTEQLASLRADVQSMLEEPGAPQTVVVLIDGDGYVPPKDQLASGRPGGSLAAMTLREAVERDLAESGIVADRFVVKYFCNRGESHRRASVSSDADDFEEGLVNTLKRLDGIDKSTVRQFLTGFSLEHRLSDLVDSGAQEQAADNDLRGPLGHSCADAADPLVQSTSVASRPWPIAAVSTSASPMTAATRPTCSG